jgi:hypothetical protein
VTVRARAALLVPLLGAAVAVASCAAAGPAVDSHAAASPAVTRAAPSPAPPSPSPSPSPLPSPVATPSVVQVDGVPVTIVRFDRSRVRLVLHAGTLDPGGTGWPGGSAIDGAELRGAVAAFNGGFKLATGSGGVLVGSRSAGALTAGDASVVMYADGGTDVGTWMSGVPAPGRPVAAVRQNLRLLVDNGVAAPDADAMAPWGLTVGGRFAVARSALGVDRSNGLIWAAGVALTPAILARALIRAGAVRAMQLDINPTWVCGFGFTHGSGTATPRPLLAGQWCPAGTYLAPYTRDFFAVVTR